VAYHPGPKAERTRDKRAAMRLLLDLKAPKQILADSG